MVSSTHRRFGILNEASLCLAEVRVLLADARNRLNSINSSLIPVNKLTDWLFLVAISDLSNSART